MIITAEHAEGQRQRSGVGMKERLLLGRVAGQCGDVARRHHQTPAAVFSRFFSDSMNPGAEIGFTGLAHKPNQKFIEEELFDGDENAIVDFKYSPTDRLTWWFDHHQSAFLSPQDEKHFVTHTWPTKFYDPT